jgi:hypothetical protein
MEKRRGTRFGQLKAAKRAFSELDREAAQFATSVAEM